MTIRWPDLRKRIAALLHREQVDQDLDEELQFHLAMEARKHAARGLSEPEAARLARLGFGGIERVTEECRSVRGLDIIETTIQDVRAALCSFRRSTGFVATVVVTIGLGLGLNAALFTIFNHYVLRPLSVRDPYRLYALGWTDRAGRSHTFSWPESQQLATDGSIYEELARTRFLFSRVDGHPMQGQLVTGNYFQMLGVGASLGRTLLPSDTAAPGREAVLVLSYAAWREAFAGDPAVIGRTVLVRGYPLEIVGVAQQGFDDIGDTPIQYWAPLTVSPQLEPATDIFRSARPDAVRVVGHLHRGLNPAQAAAALTTQVQRMSAGLAAPDRATTAVLQPKATAVNLVPELVVAFTPLVAAFVLVLCLACANVANMLLARGMARQREIGIRVSLGAGRGRLVRQLLTESVLLAVGAAILATVLSQTLIAGAVRAMYATMPTDMTEFIHTEPIGVDVRVLAFLVLAALTAAMLFGLLPALQATRGDVWLVARGEFAARLPASRLRTLLATGQVAVCLLLVVCAGILLRSADAIRLFDIGFQTEHTVVVRVNETVRSRVLAALALQPEVLRVEGATSPPMNGILPGLVLSAGKQATTLNAWYNYVSPGYFDLLGVRILEGRTFTDEESRGGNAVAILSALTARRLWPGQPAVGQTIHVRPESARGPTGLPPYDSVRVIGVAKDIVSCCIPYGKDPAIVYFAAPSMTTGTVLLLGVRGNAAEARLRLDTALQLAAPGAVEEIHPLEQYVAGGIYPFRAASWIVAALGALALGLTVSGIYGVLSCLVSQRTKEIGIRMAIGATAADVSRLVLRQSLLLAAAGVVVGGAMALLVGRLIGSKIPFVNAFDPLVYGASVTLILTTAIVAASIPARRAAVIDPMLTLRND